MNYRCGNPPSICHYFSLAKSKNVAHIISTLEKESLPNGSIYKTITHAVSKNGGSVTKAANIIHTWRENTVPTFCNGTSCDQWDASIKKVLLTFP